MSDCGCFCHGGQPQDRNTQICIIQRSRMLVCSCVHMFVSLCENQVWCTRSSPSLDNREYHGCFGLVLLATFLFPRQLVLKCLLWFLHGFVSAWEVQPGQPHTSMLPH